MVVFSSDIDWAPDEVIADMVELFALYNQKCTLFATHKSSILKQLETSDNFEIAIHPNFNKLFSDIDSNTTAEKIIDELLDVYPYSIGVRSHSTTVNSTLLQMFYDKGLKYDSNLFLPYQEVKPFKLWNEFLRIPYNWEDDVHYLYGKSFLQSDLNIKSEYKIFDFHPIHVYLNTENEERYLSAKKYYNNPKKLLEFRNTSKPGARTLLLSLLDTYSNENEAKYLLKDLLLRI